jgi:hypothetical protein
VVCCAPLGALAVRARRKHPDELSLTLR